MRIDAREARKLLRAGDFVALATQAQRLPGFPFVSHAPFALDGSGRLVLLLSRLAEHSRNLAANPRCSVMATTAGADPQAQPRVTVVGELRLQSLSPLQQDRYIRYHPEAGAFLGFGDFRFHRLEPVGIRMVGGFARAGWIEAADWACRPLDERIEIKLLAELEGALPSGCTAIGLDWEGLDLRAASGERLRLGWSEAAADSDALLALARAALLRAG